MLENAASDSILLHGESTSLHSHHRDTFGCTARDQRAHAGAHLFAAHPRSLRRRGSARTARSGAARGVQRRRVAGGAAMRKLENTSLTFSAREWVPLTDAFLQVMSNVGRRDLARNLFKRDLLSAQLGSMKILPDGTMTLLNRSDWQQLTLQVPLRPQEGVGVQPYVDGYIYVRRADLDKHYSITATPTAQQSGDIRPPERRRGPLTTHDWHSIAGEIARRCIDPKTGRVAVPKKESALVADMRTWCKEQGWAAPATSEMSEAVRRVCAALRTVQK